MNKKEMGDMFMEFLTWKKPETVELEETSTDKPKEIKLESELPVGEYELKDGTKFTIDEDGNVVGVMAPAEEEAPEAEEAASEEDLAKAAKAEEAKLAQVENDLQLAKQKEITEELEKKIIELEKATPLNNAPKQKAPKQLINLNADMTFEERVTASFHNNTK